MAMSSIDEFAASLLEEAKRFLEKAQDAEDDAEKSAYLNAALMLGFCSLEAHVNAVSDDFAARPELTPLELSILRERDVRLESGEFVLTGTKIYRLEDRILYLYRRFSAKTLDRKAAWWSDLVT
jgi:hypothetical protein